MYNGCMYTMEGIYMIELTLTYPYSMLLGIAMLMGVLCWPIIGWWGCE
jgi:hypothetical protein